VGADHRAFLEATLPYLDVVYQVARRAAGDGQDPEDLVQETYLRAYAAFGSWRGGSMRAWLAAICLNAARSEARRRRRRPWEVPARAPLDALPVARTDGGRYAADVADVVIAGLDAQAVARCLALLPEPQRVCIVLVDVAGYTAAEAGVSHGQP
jgi:RNA polymerase sigma-70 factor, ECF subfamily